MKPKDKIAAIRAKMENVQSELGKCRAELLELEQMVKAEMRVKEYGKPFWQWIGYVKYLEDGVWKHTVAGVYSTEERAREAAARVKKMYGEHVLQCLELIQRAPVDSPNRTILMQL